MPDHCGSEFDEYIEIQSLTETDDGYGGLTEEWAVKINLWAKVIDVSGTEVEVYGRLESTRSISFVTYYRDDIDEKDRVYLDGRYYYIKYIENVDRRCGFLRVVADSERT